MGEAAYAVAPFAAQDVADRGAVIALWIEEGGLALPEAQRRADGAVCVATDPDGRLAGVTDAELHVNPRLRLPLWDVRAFVARAHRGHRVLAPLYVATKAELERRYASGQDRRGAGIFLAIQHAGLRSAMGDAHGRESGAIYLGETPRGDHIRVSYFPGALAPEPGA